MALTYQAGRRVQGTATDRAAVDGVSGGWKEVGRTTLGSAGDTISVGSLSDKRYYMILNNCLASGNTNCFVRTNNDTGSNFATRGSYNGASDTTNNSNNAYLPDRGIEESSTDWFGVTYLANLSTKEKLFQTQMSNANTSGAGTAPERAESVGKWTNTSDAINRVDFLNSAAGNFDTNSEVVILGYDPDDTHTTNFWEELASVELSSAGDDISSGTFTAKKYLWVQCFMDQTSSSITGNITFNGDTGSNYARRRSNNGATDSTGTSETSIDVRGGESKNRFENMFIVNNTSQEKLVIGHHVVTTAGAGNAPDRTEYVAKWSNTSSQITSINFNNIDPGNYDTNSFIKVWGSN